MLNKVKSILEQDKNVSKVEVLEDSDSLLIELSLSKGKFLFILILPDDFPKSLPLIGKLNEEKEYPHFLKGESVTRLCYGNSEGLILSNATPEDVINYTLSQLKKLLQLSKRKVEEEFQKEFLYFYNKVTTGKRVELYVTPDDVVQKLEAKEQENRFIIKSEDVFFNNVYQKEGTVRKAIYIPLDNIEGIIPHNCGVAWDKNYILKILNENITYSNYERLKNMEIKTRKLILVFKMRLPIDFEIMFCLEIEFENKTRNYFIKKIKDNFKRLSFLHSERCDKKYLQQRIGSNLNFFNKKILVVGCGSLGSYIIQELPKIGIMNLTIVDDDILKPGNVSRHSLGMMYKFKNKASAMKKNIEYFFPESKVEAIKEKFSEKLIKNRLNLDEYDLIIITTGGTDKQLKFNELFKLNSIKTPVIFTWLESFGVGMHALLVNYKKRGCFNCLFKNENGNLITNKANFISDSIDYRVLTGDGCGAVFNPYGNTILLQGSALVLKITIELFEGKFDSKENLLFSIKSLIKRNLNYTERYYIPQEDLHKGKSDYIFEGCEICGK